MTKVEDKEFCEVRKNLIIDDEYIAKNKISSITIRDCQINNLEMDSVIVMGSFELNHITPWSAVDLGNLVTPTYTESPSYRALSEKYERLYTKWEQEKARTERYIQKMYELKNKLKQYESDSKYDW